MKSIRLWLAAFALALSGTTTLAQPFPAPGKTIRILLGVPAGGGADSQLRLLATRLQEILGTTVIVENRPGASMMIAAIQVAQAPPDGYTLLYTPSSPFAQTPHTLSNVRYDTFKDFTPISMGALGPLVLVVHKSVPARNVSELIAYGKAHPGKLNFASFGTGTSSQLYGEMFRQQTGIDMLHVPYKGAGDVQKDLVAGRVQVMFAAATGAVQYEQTGQVRMLGLTAPRRTDLLPNVPTMAEQGIKGMDIEGWLGYFGPAGMRPEVVAKLNAAFVQALATPALKDFYRKGAYEAVSSTPAEFAAIVQQSYDQWGLLIKQIGMRKE